MPSPPGEKNSNNGQRPRVVILGGGYGGVHTALRLQKAARQGKIELALVSQDNFFLSQPMLSEGLRHAAVPKKTCPQ